MVSYHCGLCALYRLRFHPAVDPASGGERSPVPPCFVCGRPLHADRLALSGAALPADQEGVLRFHPDCAARLALEVLHALLAATDPPAAAPPSLRVRPLDWANLTPRETQILELLAAGLTNRDIARTVGLHEKTVKNAVSIILSKLNVPNRTQAAALCLRAKGWPPSPPQPARSPESRGPGLGPGRALSAG
jgi:DNA-binding CsgD family transcriptional regulator